MTEKATRTRTRRTATGKIAPFTRGEELVAYTRELIEASHENTFTSFPVQAEVCRLFGASPNTVLRTWRSAQLVKEVKNARKRTITRHLAQRDKEIVNFYQTTVVAPEDGTRSAHPSLASFADEVGVERGIVTNALKGAGLLVDFKKRWAKQEEEQLAQRVENRSQTVQMRREIHEREEAERERKRQQQDAIVEDYIVTEMQAIAAGITQRIGSNIEIAASSGMTRGEVAASLHRIGQYETLNAIRQSLSVKGQAIMALRNSLAAAEEDPRIGITPYPEIARQLGTVKTVIADAAEASDLRTPLQEARETAKKKEFNPSLETAWVLGMLVGAGSIQQIDSEPQTISFTSKNTYALDAFEKSGERIFGIQGIRTTREDKGTTYINFHSRANAAALGNFKRAERAFTINKDHAWVMSEEYIDDFASGIFDARGKLTLTDKKRSLNFYTTSRTMANFYRQVLIALGIQGARIIHNSYSSEGIQGIRVSKLNDLKIFAQRINSVKPDMQEKLNLLKVLN